MKIYYELGEIRRDPKLHETAVALGTFDGVHRGHQAVLQAMKEDAEAMRLRSFVYTFSNHPKEYLSPESAPPMIMDLNTKVQLFRDMGFEALALLPFDQDQMKYSPEDFVREVLVEMLHAKHIVVGHDFTFGIGASGHADALPAYGEKYGFSVRILEPILHRGQRISSTQIREYLLGGRIEEANDLLGRKHFVRGEVVHGHARGRKLGIPTINLDGFSASIGMRTGVYFTTTRTRGELHPSITNIGYNPTFASDGKLRIETYLLRYDGELYGETVDIYFEHFHRDEISFESESALKQQMQLDLEAVHSYFQL